MLACVGRIHNLQDLMVAVEFTLYRTMIEGFFGTLGLMLEKEHSLAAG